MMDTKELFKSAIAAKIAGNSKEVADAIKQVIAARVGAILSTYPTQDEASTAGGDYHLRLQEYEYGDSVVDVDLEIAVDYYRAPTSGNYSPIASDPSEFYGDDEELEWRIVAATVISEGGSTRVLECEDRTQLVFSDDQHNFINRMILEKIHADRDDNAVDRC